jgi:hypothetical protein
MTARLESGAYPTGLERKRVRGVSAGTTEPLTSLP